ncbi:MAG TPA: DNA translocase FtsK [Solirubrobacteraceae bacterium]|nr:DNA translocase FtsK [Solirubrobacteraceae bacterium]
MAAARKPASRRKSATSRPRARAQRSSLGALGLPVIEQRHLDLIGLGLVAIGVFLVFPLYLGWDGGAAGHAAKHWLTYAVGQVAYAAPVAIVVAGALFVLRPVLPAIRPFRAGAVCLFAALTLMLAAGTLGIGPAGVRHGYWNPSFFEPRGGIVGDALLYAVASAVSTIGAHILALFLLAAGVLLLTGASVAGVLQATSSSLVDTTRAIGRVVPVPTRRPERQVTNPVPEPDDGRESGPEPYGPPEPVDSEVVVRATHVEAPAPPLPEEVPVGRQGFWSGATRFPDIYGEPLDDRESDLLHGDLAAQRHEPELVDDPEPEQLAFDEPEPEDDYPEDAQADDVTAVMAQRVLSAADLTPQGRLRGSVTDDPEFEWRLPSPGLLRRSTAEQSRPDTAGQARTAAALIEALGHFGVDAKITGTIAGPHITRFELRLAPGIKMSKVAQLKDDLAYALAATDIRILAPVPGKTAVGVEVPNQRRRIVQLGDVFQEAPKGWSPLTVWLGKDVGGKAIGADLAKMPHLLVAGTTGAGKSGAINAMLSSLLLRATPHELRLVLIDPKQVELNHYESIPHLLTPVITSPRMAANALQNLVREMEQRYSIMSLAKTRSLVELNRARAKRDEPPLPYILCVIDELADLMMVAPADVEDSIIRLAQKARAVGIHLVLATPSPRVDVITGMIKANVPSRIAFSVSSQTDSRVILDVNGAESLLGQGDMLFSPVGSSRLQRIQGAYIDEPQIEALTTFWRKQGEPELREDLLDEVPTEEDAPASGHEEGFSPDEDPLLEDAIRLCVEMGTASTSMLQRRLRLGYTRAGRLIDMLERRAVISGYEGSKPRQVLVAAADVERVIANLRERVSIGSPLVEAEPPPDAHEPEAVRE